MKKCTNKVVKTPIKLRMNEDFLHNPSAMCTLCREESYYDGSFFHYSIEGTESFVCESCAKKEAPELEAIREEALSAISMAKSYQATYIRKNIKEMIHKSHDEQIIEYVDLICR